MWLAQPITQQMCESHTQARTLLHSMPTRCSSRGSERHSCSCGIRAADACGKSPSGQVSQVRPGCQAAPGRVCSRGTPAPPTAATAALQQASRALSHSPSALLVSPPRATAPKCRSCPAGMAGTCQPRFGAQPGQTGHCDACGRQSDSWHTVITKGECAKAAFQDGHPGPGS